MSKMRLVCEGELFEIPVEAAKKSALLCNIIEDSGCEGEIPIPNMKKSILGKIIEYCEHYRESDPKPIPQPLVSEELAENGVEEWDIKFIDLEEVDDLIDMMVAANFFEIDGLIALTSAKMACFVKGKPIEEKKPQENKN